MGNQVFFKTKKKDKIKDSENQLKDYLVIFIIQRLIN